MDSTEISYKLFYLAKSPAELKAEGKALHHCVGSMGYEQKFAREETLIFFIRSADAPDVPLVTMEYSLQRNKILQIYANGNTKPTDDITTYINTKWLTSTTKARMTELENSLAEINMKIAAEESKLDRTLKKEDVEKFIIEALASEPKAMIELLIDKIILYEDRIEIFYIYGNNTDPDEPNLEVHRDFFLSNQKIKITQRGLSTVFEL